MSAEAPDAPPRGDLLGDIFDFLATAIIILGWLGTIGLCIALALAAVIHLSGKTLTFTVHGPVFLLVLSALFPIASILLGRYLRRRARTSVPARAGIAALVTLYAVFIAMRTVP